MRLIMNKEKRLVYPDETYKAKKRSLEKDGDFSDFDMIGAGIFGFGLLVPFPVDYRCYGGESKRFNGIIAGLSEYLTGSRIGERDGKWGWRIMNTERRSMRSAIFYGEVLRGVANQSRSESIDTQRRFRGITVSMCELVELQQKEIRVTSISMLGKQFRNLGSTEFSGICIQLNLRIL